MKNQLERLEYLENKLLNNEDLTLEELEELKKMYDIDLDTIEEQEQEQEKEKQEYKNNPSLDMKNIDKENNNKNTKHKEEEEEIFEFIIDINSDSKSESKSKSKPTTNSNKNNKFDNVDNFNSIYNENSSKLNSIFEEEEKKNILKNQEKLKLKKEEELRKKELEKHKEVYNDVVIEKPILENLNNTTDVNTNTNTNLNSNSNNIFNEDKLEKSKKINKENDIKQISLKDIDLDKIDIDDIDLDSINIDDIDLDNIDIDDIDLDFDDLNLDLDDLDDLDDLNQLDTKNKKKQKKKKKKKNKNSKKIFFIIGFIILTIIISIIIISKFIKNDGQNDINSNDTIVQEEVDTKDNILIEDNIKSNEGFIKDYSSTKAVIETKDGFVLYAIDENIYNDINEIDKDKIIFYNYIDLENNNDNIKYKIIEIIKDKEVVTDDSPIEIEVKDKNVNKDDNKEEKLNTNLPNTQNEVITIKKDINDEKDLWFQLSWRENVSNTTVLKKEDVKFSLISPSGRIINNNLENYFEDENTLNYFIQNGEKGEWVFHIEKLKQGSLGDIATNVIANSKEPIIDKISIKQSPDSINVLWSLSNIDHFEIGVELESKDNKYQLNKYNSVNDKITINDSKEFNIKNIKPDNYNVIITVRNLDVRKDKLGSNYIYRKLVQIERNIANIEIK